MTQAQKAAIIFFAIPLVAVVITRFFSEEPPSATGRMFFGLNDWTFWFTLLIVLILIAMGWYAYTRKPGVR